MLDRRWSILAILFVARTAMAFQFQSIGSTAPLLITDLHIGYGAIGTLIGLYMLPGIILAFPGGLLSQRFGDKAVCAAGLGLMMAGGILLAISHGWTAVFIGRLISGAGAVLFSLVITKMTTDWFAGREIVLAMGVVLASWPFGITAGLLLQPPLAAAYGWPSVMHATTALCGVALLIMTVGYREPPRDAPSSPSGEQAMPVLPPLRQVLPTTVAAVMWGNLNLTLVLFFSFAPAAMTERGVAAATTAAWTGAALWVLMLSVPLGGLGVQRTGRPNGAIVLFCAIGALALALLPVGVAPLALAAAFGVAAGPPAGAIMALPARVLSPRHRAGGLGLFLACYYAILTFGPALAGTLRELSGKAAVPVWLAAALMGSVVPLLGLFGVLEGRIDER